MKSKIPIIVIASILILIASIFIYNRITNTVKNISSESKSVVQKRTGEIDSPLISNANHLIDAHLSKDKFVYYKLPTYVDWKAVPALDRNDPNLVLIVKINNKTLEWAFGKDPFNNDEFNIIGYKIHKDYHKNTTTIQVTHKKIKDERNR